MRAIPQLRAALACLFLLCAGVTADAIPPGAQIAVARARLECLLASRLRARAGLEARQRAAQANLAHLQAFRARLHPTNNAGSIVEADTGIAATQNALATLARQLSVADRDIATTRRAITNLIQPPAAPSLYEQARRQGNVALANAFHCGQGSAFDPVAYYAVQVRLLMADSCGHRDDAFYEGRNGLSQNPVLVERLNRIVAQLDTVSAHTTVKLLMGCPAGGAFSTSTSSYLGECDLVGRSDEEVAFVVAHERAHVSLQHVTLTSVARTIDRAVHGNPTRLTESPAVQDDIVRARMQDYNRAQEYEADLAGAETAMAAGYSPRGIDMTVTRWSADEAAYERTMIASEGNAGLAALRLRYDHPSAEERRQALESVLGARFWEMDPSSIQCGPH